MLRLQGANLARFGSQDVCQSPGRCSRIRGDEGKGSRLVASALLDLICSYLDFRLVRTGTFTGLEGYGLIPNRS